MPSVLSPCRQAWQTLRGECGPMWEANFGQTPLGYNLFTTEALEKIPVLRRCKVQKGKGDVASLPCLLQGTELSSLTPSPAPRGWEEALDHNLSFPFFLFPWGLPWWLRQ